MEYKSEKDFLNFCKTFAGLIRFSLFLLYLCLKVILCFMLENVVAIEDSITIDSFPLSNSYLYIVEDSSTVVFSGVDFSKWTTLYDFKEHFPFPAHSKKILSIKDAYPGKSGTPIHRGIQTEIWFTPLLFLVFFCYGFVFFRKKKALLQDLKELFTFSFRNDASREESSADNFHSRILLVIAGIVNISLFSFFAISDPDTENFTLVLSLLLIMTILFILFKIMAIRLICYVFFDKSLFSAWIKAFYSLVLFSGIALIPVILCRSFGPVTWINPVMYTGYILCICLSILYLSKIATFFLRNVSSLFHLILYLCSLEILPAYIFLKGLINAVNSNGIII